MKVLLTGANRHKGKRMLSLLLEANREAVVLPQTFRQPEHTIV
jgi:hypothetical protein